MVGTSSGDLKLAPMPFIGSLCKTGSIISSGGFFSRGVRRAIQLGSVGLIGIMLSGGTTWRSLADRREGSVDWACNISLLPFDLLDLFDILR